MAPALTDVRSLGTVPAIFDAPYFPRRTSLVLGTGGRESAGDMFRTDRSPKIEILGRCATPTEILLGSLNHPSLCLRKPIPLKIDREDEHIVAAWPEFDEFGYGAHLTVALEDFRQTLVELYLSLENDQENLGPELQKALRSLREWISKK